MNSIDAMLRRQDVDSFLKELKGFVKVGKLYFRKAKSEFSQTLLDIEIPVTKVKEILNQLMPEDFVERHRREVFNGKRKNWCFCKKIKTVNVLFGIDCETLAIPNILVSIEPIETPLLHPFKSINNETENIIQQQPNTQKRKEKVYISKGRI